MWVKTTKQKLNDYNVQVTTQRELADDETIMHMELQDNPEFFIAIRQDLDVKLFLDEELEELNKIDSTEEITTEVEGEIIVREISKEERKNLLIAKEQAIEEARIINNIKREDLLDSKKK
jgi:hypothetical protein